MVTGEYFWPKTIAVHVRLFGIREHISCMMLSCVYSELLSFQTSHAKRQQKVAEDWAHMLPNLIQLHADLSEPPTHSCIVCGDEVDEVIVCQDCGPAAAYCDTCFPGAHRLTWHHIPKKWKVCLSMSL